MPLPLMATHMSSFPRSSLLKGGTVPGGHCLIVARCERLHRGAPAEGGKIKLHQA
jgi:hypothetical protein